MVACAVLVGSLLMSYFQCNINVFACAVDVVGIQRLDIFTSEDAALATRLAIVEASPCFEHIVQALLFSR